MKILTRLLIALSILIISGCSTSPKALQTDYWSKINNTEIPISGHVALPKLEPAIDTKNKLLVFDKKASKTLNDYMQASKANVKIIAEYNYLISQIEMERGAFIQAGKLTEERSNFLAEKYSDAENGRRYEAQMRILERAVAATLLIFLGI